MDSKFLLLRIITLLYLESVTLKKGNTSSTTLAKETLKYIATPEAANIADFSKDPVTRLREVLNWMLEQEPEHIFEKNDLLQRMKIACETDDYLYDAAAQIIQPELSSAEIARIISTNREEINTFINKSIVSGIIKEAYYATAFRPETIDWSLYVKHLQEKLEPYELIGRIDRSTQVSSIDLTDPDSLAANMREGLKTVQAEGSIRFGWQGFNKLFGQQGGGRRGEMIVIGALQHNFKSGTSLELVKAAALYNKPYMIDPNKKPLILRFSFENPAIVDILHIYTSLIEAETGVRIDQSMIDPIIAAIYVSERLSVNGYKVIFEQHKPSDMTYMKLFDIIEDFENRGYEIHMLNLDYLAMISTKGCKQGATGQDIRDLFRRVRNFIEPKKILTITPHQLSVEAKKKTREGMKEEDFVREIANKGYWDSCSTIDQEVDMEIYQHLVKIGGRTFITFMRGKHRKAGTPTPFEDYYCVYEFGDVGFIPDDIHGVSNSRKKVGAASAANQSEWWAEPV